MTGTTRLKAPTATTAATQGREARRLSTLLEVSQALSGTLNLKAALHRVLEILARHHGAVRSLVTLLREGGELSVDLFRADISQATVVTLYLLRSINLRLQPKLMRELKPGTRVVSHRFDMGDWKPEQDVTVRGAHVYLWRIPNR